MPVPAEIREVPRPPNTIIDDSGRDGPKRYAVWERSYTKYVSNGNPPPHNGKVIGHIINMKYVPIADAPSKAAAAFDMLSYEASALGKSILQDFKEDLLAVYDPSDVFAIMSLATLKVIKPAITEDMVNTHYLRTFVCRDYPKRCAVRKLCRKSSPEDRDGWIKKKAVLPVPDSGSCRRSSYRFRRHPQKGKQQGQ